jgi:predicted transcriptional regulator
VVSVQLDPDHQARLDELARSQGQDGASFAARILTDYLDFEALPKESDTAWAEASVALTPEVMDQEDWDQPDHGS